MAQQWSAPRVSPGGSRHCLPGLRPPCKQLRLLQTAAAATTGSATNAAPAPSAQQHQDQAEIDDLGIDIYLQQRQPKRAEVPNERIITNQEYLEWLGNGTPVIQGGDWPNIYQDVNKRIADTRHVELPRPHPKFTMEDLKRIREHGPTFDDLVLEHVEVTHEGGVQHERGEEYLRRLQMNFPTDSLEKQGQEGSNGLFAHMFWDEFWKRDPWKYGLDDVERDHNEVYDLREGDAEGVKVWEFNQEKYLEWKKRINDWLDEHFAVPKYAQAYSFVPRMVLGDYQFDTEPNWLGMQQLPFMQFYQGVRERNWTSKHYKPSAEPWRLQFYTCDYSLVTGWPGWRAVITLQDGRQMWADMPESGQETFLKDHTSGGTSSATWRYKRSPQEYTHPSQYGYNQVFEQVFQAYEQRLPKEGVEEFHSTQFITPGKYEYDCPGERILDASWHRSPSPVTSELELFMLRPSWEHLTQLFSGFVWTPTLLVPVVSPAIGFVLEGFVLIAVITFLIAVIRFGIVSQQKKGMGSPSDTQAFSEDPELGMIFGRAKATARKEGATGVGFGDVAGLDPILGELLEVVEFLKDPRSFSKLGARAPKGVLLEGDPGTGKTLLSKSIAGEALVPFFQMSGSEFVEGIIGVGAARIRDLFKRARAAAPCVVFVDELDALGLKRADQSGTANEEREQTLNQLLTEMDGFTPDVGVVFIGATNRADLLDPALLRPGRFDRKIRMPKPDAEARLQILRVHLRGKNIAPEVDLLQVARDLPGLVGADLAAVVNEASIHALKQKHTQITMADMYAGVDRLTQGALRQPLPADPIVLQVYGARECGTALVGTVLRKRHGRVEPVERVSIQPRGMTLSRCMFMRNPDEDYSIITRGRLLDRIKVVLAGEVAIRVIMGEGTNFGTPDIKRATRMAEKFVMWYGMAGFGIPMFAFEPLRPEDLGRGKRKKKLVTVEDLDLFADFPSPDDWKWRFEPWNPSDVTWHRYQDEVRKVMKQCWEETWELCEQHKDALWASVRAISERRELLGPELREIFDQYPPKPLEHKYDSKMKIWRETPADDKWPYNVEFLTDAYPTPYWVQQRAAAAAAAAARGTAPPPPPRATATRT